MNTKIKKHLIKASLATAAILLSTACFAHTYHFDFDHTFSIDSSALSHDSTVRVSSATAGLNATSTAQDVKSSCGTEIDDKCHANLNLPDLTVSTSKNGSGTCSISFSDEGKVLSGGQKRHEPSKPAQHDPNNANTLQCGPPGYELYYQDASHVVLKYNPLLAKAGM